MKSILLYFLMLFLSFFAAGFCLRFVFWIYTEYCQQEQQRCRNTPTYLERQMRDRQGNNFSQANETGRDNRCNDIFFIEPNSLEAARIRAQLEKDDKELPSYDEVMRIVNLSTATAAPAANNLINSLPCAVSNSASSSSVNTTNTTLTVPSYTEAGTNLRPLTPPPYTPEPIGVSAVLPIATPLHAQQNTQS